MGLLIGIIDDDIVSQFATLYILEQSNYPCEILKYDSAESALQSFAKDSLNGGSLPDVLILDLGMPGMDGWEFLEEFKNIGKANRKTKVYVLSAFSNAKDRLKAKEHPSVLGYFDKPLSKINLEQIFLSATV